MENRTFRDNQREIRPARPRRARQAQPSPFGEGGEADCISRDKRWVAVRVSSKRVNCFLRVEAAEGGPENARFRGKGPAGPERRSLAGAGLSLEPSPYRGFGRFVKRPARSNAKPKEFSENGLKNPKDSQYDFGVERSNGRAERTGPKTGSAMKSSARPKSYVTDQMLFISLGLALFYWICESFLNIFLSNKVNIFELLFGANIDEVWARIVVLCLFIIFGSHAQFIIDNRKKAEDALRGSEERYRTLVENIPLGICRVTPGPEGRFLMANPAASRMLGFREEAELRSIRLRDIYLRPRDSETFSQRLLAHQKLNWEEIQFKRADGTPVWGSVSARLVSDPADGTPLYFDCIIEDIDERKKARLKIEQEAETRRRFQKLLSPDLAEMVVSGDLQVEKGGTRRTATVLFADIRGFTSLSENTEADEIVQMLNEYFETMVEVVFRLEGTVDKYIGDAIMVLWGAPIAHPDAPIRAVQAAIEMRKRLKEFNKRRKAFGKQAIQVGVGVNTGPVVAGYIGSTRTMSYSVIGDTVNTASRLCAAARAGQILIADSTYAHIRDQFSVTRLAPLQVKGKLQPIHVYEVHGAALCGAPGPGPIFPSLESALPHEETAL